MLSILKMEDGREGIQKTFHFADFNQAFSFMQRTALLAEKVGKHFSSSCF